MNTADGQDDDDMDNTNTAANRQTKNPAPQQQQAIAEYEQSAWYMTVNQTISTMRQCWYIVNPSDSDIQQQQIYKMFSETSSTQLSLGM